MITGVNFASRVHILVATNIRDGTPVLFAIQHPQNKKASGRFVVLSVPSKTKPSFVKGKTKKIMPTKEGKRSSTPVLLRTNVLQAILRVGRKTPPKTEEGRRGLRPSFFFEGGGTVPDPKLR